MQHRWSNQATQEFAEWLVLNVMGQELARELSSDAAPQDTPVTNLAVKLRGIMIKSLPFPMDPRWMATINWVEVAAYLVSTVDPQQIQDP